MANRKPRSHRSPNNKCVFCGRKLCVNVLTVEKVSIFRIGGTVPEGVACYPFCDRVDYQEI